MTERLPEWVKHFPALEKITDAAWMDALAEAQVVILPAEVEVFHETQQCSNFLLVIDGSVRVQKLSESGREIVLYRVEEGQSCLLTTACLLAGKPYSAEGYTETSVTAVLLPHRAFQQALNGSQAFREFVFNVYAERVTDLLMLIDAISFGRIDQRLAAYLLEHAEVGGVLQRTHQQLARDLGTAREVISRVLKEFERHGLVGLGRGRLSLDDQDGLRRIANVS